LLVDGGITAGRTRSETMAYFGMFLEKFRSAHPPAAARAAGAGGRAGKPQEAAPAVCS
jgi:hypothetical protein